MRLVLFLGAGFSALAGLPLGEALFRVPPPAHSHRAATDIECVIRAYQSWQGEHPVARAEEFVTDAYAAYEQRRSDSLGLWSMIVRFLGYRLAAPFATFYAYEGRISRARDNIFEATTHPIHQEWWEVIFEALWKGSTLEVITTNWDILIERALRPAPTARAPRKPGFHYGIGPERLAATSAFPRSPWRSDPTLRGLVPLLKLHGSLNWSEENSQLVKYGDLRPAFRGDAAIVPPTRFKSVPIWGTGIWHLAESALRGADCILAVGYSFPLYDTSVLELFRDAVAFSHPHVHIFSPNSGEISNHLNSLLSGTHVYPHAGLPEGTRVAAQLLS